MRAQTAVTMSLPPQVTPELLLVNVPADYKVPQLAFELAGIDRNTRLVHRCAIFAVGEDRYAQREPDVFVEARYSG